MDEGDGAVYERTALATGASRGMGQRLAERLAARATTVVLCANTPERLEEVRRGIEARGGRAMRLDDTVDCMERAIDLRGAGARLPMPVAALMTAARMVPSSLYQRVLGHIVQRRSAAPRPR